MKVSIITITHNRAHLIGETIQSVLDQTYADFEHIIIDDGSTDDTEEVVNNFNDKRIQYFKYEKNEKRSFLRNEGFRKATGALLSILDSDDLWARDKLETITAIFNENPEVCFAIHNLSFFRGDKIYNAFQSYKTDFFRNILQDLLSNAILPFSIFTIKKDILDKIGLFDEAMIDGQQDLYIRAASKFRIYYCARKLAFIRKHDGNISRVANMAHYEDFIKTLDKLKKSGAISNNKYVFLMSNNYYKMARIYEKRHELGKAAENYNRSFRSKLFCAAGLKSFILQFKYINK